jgi:regulator of protease activity HflC (stomatin/prohibitin superfamily)
VRPAASLLCALCGCATIPPGAGGVLWTPSSGVQREPLGEGQHFIGPAARVTVYDLRAQERNEDLVGLTADGALVEAGASLVTYHLDAAALPAIESSLGPDYYRRAVSPLVRSTARRVLARVHVSQLDTAGIRLVQTEITDLLRERLLPLHVVLDGVALRRVTPLSPAAYQAVLSAGALEQAALSAPALLQLARHRADELRESARGISASHAIVAPTLSRHSLDEAFLRAWEQLLSSPATHTAVLPPASPLLLEVPP